MATKKAGRLAIPLGRPGRATSRRFSLSTIVPAEDLTNAHRHLSRRHSDSFTLGSIYCESFLNDFETNVFVDGDLIVRLALVDAFEHASLTVTGKLAAKLFVGADIWAEVGGEADLEYGDGYCLPIGWEGQGDASGQVIRSVHSEQETVDFVAIPANLGGGYLFDGTTFRRPFAGGQYLTCPWGVTMSESACKSRSNNPSLKRSKRIDCAGVKLRPIYARTRIYGRIRSFDASVQLKVTISSYFT